MIKQIRIVVAGALLLAAPALAQDTPTPPTPPAPTEIPSARGGGSWSRTIRMGGAYLGVMLENVDATNRAELGAPEASGAVITSVTDGSPADEAGLQNKDIVVGFNGTRVESATHLSKLVRETPAGQRVRLDVVRNGATTSLDVTLGKRKAAIAQGYGFPEGFNLGNMDSLNGHLRIMTERMDSIGRVFGDSMRFYFNTERMDSIGRVFGDSMRLYFNSEAPRGQVRVLSRRGRLGVELQPLTGQLAKYFGVQSQKGVLVSTVADSGAARSAGLEAGDVIVSIDGKAVSTPAEVSRIIAEKDAGDIEMRIVRDRREQTVRVTVPKNEPMVFPFNGSGAFGEGPWTEFKEGEGPWTQFYKHGEGMQLFGEGEGMQFFNDGDMKKLEIDLDKLNEELEELREHLEEMEIEVDVDVDVDDADVTVAPSAPDHE